ASTPRARISHEVLLNEDPQLLFGGGGHGGAIGEDGVGQRRTTLAGACFGHFGHRQGHHAAGVLGVLHQVGDDVVDGDGVVFGMPAIVIRHHGDGDVADLGFACQLGFLQVGHADNVHSPGAVNVGFGLGGKGGAFHAKVGAAPMDVDAGGVAGSIESGAHLGTDGVGEADVGHQSL